MPSNSGVQLKTIAIFAGVDKALVKTRLQSRAISGCGQCVPQVIEEAVEQSTNIVAQLGLEPFLDAMTANPEFNNIKLFGAFTHMGKIMECGGQCAQPKSAGAIGTLYPNGEFDVAPLDPKAVCTPLSVAAHTLYEKTRPGTLHGPGGHLDLMEWNYEQLSDSRSVKISGSTFHFPKEAGSQYTLKLEAARVVRYRTVFMVSIRDSILNSQIGTLIETIKGYVRLRHAEISGQWKVDIHVHGRNTDQVFPVAEVLADPQILATSVASTTRVATAHGPCPHQKATSGNFALGIGGKLEIEMGLCAESPVYHLMNLQPGEERLHPQASYEPILTNGDISDKLAIRHYTRAIGSGKSSSSASPTPPAIHADVKKVTVTLSTRPRHQKVILEL
ncbi:hypothetical protein SCAR479_12550 [Seiridium cardinale]|uniref:Uncharacterized protein n=1 Tax=Seiridium cardinale TaxID=138064 RepID=A0ABR2XAH6_9PEZI